MATMIGGIGVFMPERPGAMIGASNLHAEAVMRGKSFEDFMKTRNTRVLYSGAVQDAADRLATGTGASNKESLASDSVR